MPLRVLLFDLSNLHILFHLIQNKPRMQVTLSSFFSSGKSGVVAHACNHSTQEAELWDCRFQVQSQLGLHSKILSPKK
jgi:hypothetical protein